MISQKDTAIYLENPNIQETTENDWVSTQDILKYKPKPITVDDESTNTTLRTYDQNINTGDAVWVYNGQDGGKLGTLGNITDFPGEVQNLDEKLPIEMTIYSDEFNGYIPTNIKFNNNNVLTVTGFGTYVVYTVQNIYTGEVFIPDYTKLFENTEDIGVEGAGVGAVTAVKIDENSAGVIIGYNRKVMYFKLSNTGTVLASKQLTTELPTDRYFSLWSISSKQAEGFLNGSDISIFFECATTGPLFFKTFFMKLNAHTGADVTALTELSIDGVSMTGVQSGSNILIFNVDGNKNIYRHTFNTSGALSNSNVIYTGPSANGDYDFYQMFRVYKLNNGKIGLSFRDKNANENGRYDNTILLLNSSGSRITSKYVGDSSSTSFSPVLHEYNDKVFCLFNSSNNEFSSKYELLNANNFSTEKTADVICNHYLSGGGAVFEGEDSDSLVVYYGSQDWYKLYPDNVHTIPDGHDIDISSYNLNYKPVSAGKHSAVNVKRCLVNTEDELFPFNYPLTLVVANTNTAQVTADKNNAIKQGDKLLFDNSNLVTINQVNISGDGPYTYNIFFDEQSQVPTDIDIPSNFTEPVISNLEIYDGDIVTRTYDKVEETGRVYQRMIEGDIDSNVVEIKTKTQIIN